MADPAHQTSDERIVAAAIMQRGNDDEVLIWSGEHGAWWRAGGHGYTDYAMMAGVWPRAEAERQTRHCCPSKKIVLETLAEARSGRRPKHPLEDEVARLRAALRIIAGEAPCADNLLGNSDIARIALHGR